MKTIQLLLNDKDFCKYHFAKETMTLSEIKEKIETELFQEAIEKSIEIAQRTGLSKISLREINAETLQARNRA